MSEEKEITTISVTKDVRDDLMIFKFKTNAKNVSEVMERIIQKLKSGDFDLELADKSPTSKEEPTPSEQGEAFNDYLKQKTLDEIGKIIDSEHTKNKKEVQE